jgi:hypothetical protein
MARVSALSCAADVRGAGFEGLWGRDDGVRTGTLCGFALATHKGLVSKPSRVMPVGADTLSSHTTWAYAGLTQFATARADVGLPHKPAGTGIVRYQPAPKNFYPSRLLICGLGFKSLAAHPEVFTRRVVPQMTDIGR